MHIVNSTTFILKRVGGRKTEDTNQNLMEVPVLEYPPISAYFFAEKPFPHHRVYGTMKLFKSLLRRSCL